MRWIRAVILAFSTYSRIPAPQITWDDDVMALAIVFLPFVGVVIGSAVWGLVMLCRAWELGAVLFAAAATALPVWITGGIHMDGYCDTSDALASWQDPQRRLAILKDPHVGAFALIRFGVCLLLNFALFHELYIRGVDFGFLFIYPLSRCLAVWSALTLPNARKEGMLAAFTTKADGRKVRVILSLLTALALAGWCRFSFPFGCAGLVLCAPVTLWYRRMVRRRFGGVTGDTTGYYLQILELVLFTGLLTGEVMRHWL